MRKVSIVAILVLVLAASAAARVPNVHHTSHPHHTTKSTPSRTTRSTGGLTGSTSAGSTSTGSTGASGSSSAPPPSGASCTATLAAGRDLGSFVAGLGSGQVGCLSGSYAGFSTSHGGWTLRPAPGATATIDGVVELDPGANGVTITGLTIDGASSSQNTLQFFADNIAFTHNDVTNERKGASCLYLGDTSYGIAHNPLIDHNTFHDCGANATIGGDHGIYLAYQVGGHITNNIIRDSAGFGVQFYPNVQNVDFEHNRIDGTAAAAGIIFAGDSGTPSSGNTVAWNVIENTHSVGIDSWWGGSVGSGNVASHNCFWQTGSGDFGSTSGWSDGGGNVHADPTSSACASMGPR